MPPACTFLRPSFGARGVRQRPYACHNPRLCPAGQKASRNDAGRFLSASACTNGEAACFRITFLRTYRVPPLANDKSRVDSIHSSIYNDEEASRGGLDQFDLGNVLSSESSKTMKTEGIVFVQREVEDKLGPMILTAYLKSHGHKAAIVIDPLRNIKTIQNMQPAFIAISVLSPSVNWALETSRRLKAYIPEARVILGGPHPTYSPEVIEEDGVDIICIGEGEKPLLHLLSSYDGTMDSIKKTPNCWVKNGSTVTKNPLSPLLSEDELSQLPPCDRSHYSAHSALRRSPHKKTWTSRGCPFNCSYCFNHQYKQLYKGLGKMVRQRSVDSVIEELKELKRFGWNCLEMAEDQFILSKAWIYEFCEKYARHIGLPFSCPSTAKQIDDDIVVALKEAGCKTICFGIESGNESIRQTIYRKPVSDEDI